MSTLKFSIWVGLLGLILFPAGAARALLETDLIQSPVNEQVSETYSDDSTPLLRRSLFLGQVFDPSDSFQMHSFPSRPSVSPIPNVGLPQVPNPSLLPVPLDGIPSGTTPWLPGRNVPAPQAPSLGQQLPALGGPFQTGVGVPPASGSMVLVIPNASALPPDVLSWLTQYQQSPYLQNAYPQVPYQQSPYLPNSYQPNLVPQSPQSYLPQPTPSPITPYIPGLPTSPVPGLESLSNSRSAGDLAVAPVADPSLYSQGVIIPQLGTTTAVPQVSPRRLPIGEPSLTLQGGLVVLDNEFSGRARVSGFYPVSPDIALSGAVEVSEGTIFSDSELEGVNINELILTLSPRDVPNLRLSIGQLDLTSYFDRNSFAKDGLTHFFSPNLQTNPALAANGLGSRTGALVNYAITDNVEARASLFSSDRSISEFDLTGFAGELGFRTGNAIIRGTYVSAIDGGANDGPNEIFGQIRPDGTVGIAEGDREESLGINAEVFIPEMNMGLFGRYGRYENQDADLTGDTFSGGVNFLDLFMSDDRLGVGYGRSLSNNDVRRARGEEMSDVWEVFYDFRVSPNLRAGFTLQQVNEFTETVAGFRLKSEFDVVP